MWLEIDNFDHFVYSRLNFLQTAAPVYVRLMLVRSDPFYRDVPVSGVCARHQQEVVPGTNHHVIRAARDEGQSRVCYVAGGDVRPNLCFPLVGINALDPMIHVSFTCSDMCITGAMPVATERSRGLVLCLTLETFMPNVVLARRVVKVSG